MTPTYKLDVAGTARATDGIITNNLIVKNMLGVPLNTPQYRIHASQSAGWISGSSAHATGLIAVGGGNNLVDDQNIVFPNPATTDGVVSGLNWWSPDFVISRYKNEFAIAFKETHGGALGNATKDIMRAYVYDSGGYSNLSRIQFLGEDTGANAGFASYTQYHRLFVYSPGNQSGNVGNWGLNNGISVGGGTVQTSNSASLNFNMYKPSGSDNQSNWIGTIICLRPSVAWLTMYTLTGENYIYYYGSQVSYLSGNGWVNVSDAREKNDIQPLKTENSLKKILSSKPVHYFRNQCEETNPVPDHIKNKRHIGFLAQDQLETNPHCVSSWKKRIELPKNETTIVEDEEECKDECCFEERLGICYNDYVIHLVGAVQEQQKMIEKQQAEIDELKVYIQQQNNLLRQIVEKINSVA